MADTGCAGLPLVFEPGEVWHYGTGIDVAGLMIEAATGREVVTYHSQVVFDPPRLFEIFLLDGPPGDDR